MKASIKILIVGLLVVGLMGTIVSSCFSAATMDIGVSLEKGVKAPTKIQNDIKGITKTLILENFKAD